LALEGSGVGFLSLLLRISDSLLADKATVDKTLTQVSEIQGGRETEVRQTPLIDLTKR
jgi:hypothetical protein